MEISKDKVVSVHYELRTEESGQIVEKTNAEQPLVFLYGHGNMLPKFEENLSGLKVGDKFKFKLSSQDAYGKYRDDAVLDVPKSAFEVDGKVEDGLLDIGNIVPMMDNQGNHFDGVVKEVTDDVVKMDFNHPMAGKDLYFEGEVVDIRDATAEEIEHGHVH